MSVLTLNDLRPGQTGLLEAIESSQPGVVRLMVLGLVEGVMVRIESVAIGGDPIEIRVLGASISVRREQGRHFRVSRQADLV